MTDLSKILDNFFEEDTCEFHREILNAYRGDPSFVTLQPELVKVIEAFSGTSVESLEEYLYAVCVPGAMETASQQQVLLRKKTLINTFWKKQKAIDITGCTVSVSGSTKAYKRDGELVAASFNDGQSGQFGEFSSPLIDRETLEVLYECFCGTHGGIHGGACGANTVGTSKWLSKIQKFLKTCSTETHFIPKTKKGFIEIQPLSLFGIKAVPITVREEAFDEEIRANDGTFSAEVVANAQYERLVIEDCAFTPFFSKGTKTEFDIKMFTSEIIITANRLQKTLRAIKREAEKLKNYPDSPLSWNIVNDDNLEGSLFSNKVGLFVTTTVGKSISDPPIVEREELVSLIVDAFWTVEQAIANKIYLTDLNIGNILYYDMKSISELCGYPAGIPTVREYSWDTPGGTPQSSTQGSQQGSLRIRNTYTRLVFVDVGTSFLEKPSFGKKKVVDLSPPMTRDFRMELQATCRKDVISALMYCVVVNGGELDLVNAIGNLNTGKNLFLQFLPHVAQAEGVENLEVSEKYTARVFR